MGVNETGSVRRGEGAIKKNINGAREALTVRSMTVMEDDEELKLVALTTLSCDPQLQTSQRNIEDGQYSDRTQNLAGAYAFPNSRIVAAC